MEAKTFTISIILLLIIGLTILDTYAHNQKFIEWCREEPNRTFTTSEDWGEYVCHDFLMENDPYYYCIQNPKGSFDMGKGRHDIECECLNSPDNYTWLEGDVFTGSYLHCEIRHDHNREGRNV